MAAIGTIIGAVGAATQAAVNAAKKKKQTTSSNSNSNIYQSYLNSGTNKAAASPTYSANTDYQALINQAVQSGNSSLARQYEAQRNAKIAGMNASGTNTAGYQQTSYYQPLNIPEYKPYDTSSLPKLTLPEYKPFSYKDFNYSAENDDVYKQYAEQFARQGQAAGENALASTAAATGGMPSSYASAANAQAQQAYAKKTADIIPELEQNAYNRYQNERNFSYQDYLNQYNSDTARAQALYNADWQNTNFSYEDYLNQYNAGVDRAKTAYDSETALRDFNYKNYIDALNQTNWEKEYGLTEKQTNADIDNIKWEQSYKEAQAAIDNAIAQGQLGVSRSNNALGWADLGQRKDESSYERSLKERELSSNEQLEKQQAQKQADDEGDARTYLSEYLVADDKAAYFNRYYPKLSEEARKIVDSLISAYGKQMPKE